MLYLFDAGVLSSQLAPSHAESVVEAMHRVNNPHQMCVKLHEMISQLLTEIREIAVTNPNSKLRFSSSHLY